jgi:hypothetical protein
LETAWLGVSHVNWLFFGEGNFWDVGEKAGALGPEAGARVGELVSVVMDPVPDGVVGVAAVGGFGQAVGDALVEPVERLIPRGS